MKKIVKENIPLQAFTLSPEDALQKLADMGEPYKVELCEEHAGKGEPISFYEQADFYRSHAQAASHEAQALSRRLS